MNGSKVPPGIYCIRAISGRDFGLREYRVSVLVITFIAYACYHASRKPLSIVKSVLDPEYPSGGRDSNPADFTLGNISWAISPASSPQAPILGRDSEVGWGPFNGKFGKARLGDLDLAFLASYSIGIIFAGHLGDRLDLRMFLTFGMVGSGIFVCLFGMGYWWDVHLFSYYFILQIITGLLSSTGWPAVVAVVAHWHGKYRRGLIMGIWSAHTSTGNIVGSLIAASALHHGWGWSFVLLGIFIILGGILVFSFLVVEPGDVGLPSPYEAYSKLEQKSEEIREEKENLLDTGKIDVSSKLMEMHIELSIHPKVSETPSTAIVNGNSFQPQEERAKGSFTRTEYSLVLEDQQIGDVIENCPCPSSTMGDTAIGFVDAWKIPGLIEYALCLFFVKLVAYTFLFWLPFYIRHTKIAGMYLSDKMAGNLSTIFDVGGVLGGIIAGHLSDKYNARATSASFFVYCSIPALCAFRAYGGVSLIHMIALMSLAGVCVNGPYALITTAVSADLGTHISLKENAKALATVTAIIDGIGSVGAAVGPFLTGYVSVGSWNGVFVMLAFSSLIAGILLTKLIVAEVRDMLSSQRTLAMVELRQKEIAGTGEIL